MSPEQQQQARKGTSRMNVRGQTDTRGWHGQVSTMFCCGMLVTMLILCCKVPGNLPLLLPLALACMLLIVLQSSRLHRYASRHGFDVCCFLMMDLLTIGSSGCFSA